MKSYQYASYAFQTEAAGLRDKDALTRTFSRQVPIHEWRVLKFLPQNREARILDCPCGNGHFSYFLREMGFNNVESIDLDQKQIDLARLVGLAATKGDAFEWLLGKEHTYDVIASLDFLEHLEKNNALRFLELCFSALKDGGKLILRMPCAEGPLFGGAAFNDLTHEWVATSGVVRNMLSMVHFGSVKVLDDGPIPYKAVNVLRYLAFRVTCQIGCYWGKFTGIGAPTIWTPNMWVIATRARELTAVDALPTSRADRRVEGR